VVQWGTEQEQNVHPPLQQTHKAVSSAVHMEMIMILVLVITVQELFVLEPELVIPRPERLVPMVPQPISVLMANTETESTAEEPPSWTLKHVYPVHLLPIVQM